MARFKRGDPKPPTSGRKKGTPNKLAAEHKAFLSEILHSEEYRQSFRRRAIKGDASLELLMHHYVLGKPKDTLSIDRMPPLLVIDKLEAGE